MSACIAVRDLSFSLPDGREIFGHLNFSLSAGITALTGANGVGKTLLARLIAGDLLPTQGSVHRQAPVSLLRQREAPPALSVREFLAASPARTRNAARLLQGIDHAWSCRALSGGQWMRVRLVRALGDGFLILDEPTNDLDREARAIVAQVVRAHRGGVLLISHDCGLLSLCSTVLELSNGGMSQLSGGWTSYLQARDSERERLGNALDRAKRERDRHSAAMQEQRDRQARRNQRGSAAAARGGTPRILLGASRRQAQQTTGRREQTGLRQAQKVIDDVRSALSELKTDPVMYARLAGRKLAAGRLIAEASDFNIHRRDWLYAPDLNFTWRGNVRVAVRGGNGSGKSTLLQSLLGSEFQTRGRLRRGDAVALFIDQRLDRLEPQRSVLENVSAFAQGTESELRTGLSHFLFTAETVFQRVGELSGGERLRTALAQGFLAQRGPELLVFDEPTNNLDAVNVEFLANVIREFHGAVIVASHDEHFLDACGLTGELSLR